jgi:hypothetical protein
MRGRIAAVRSLVLGLAGLGLGLLGAAQCSFSPDLAAGNGALRCAADVTKACPEGYACSPNGLCCKSGDVPCLSKVVTPDAGITPPPDMGVTPPVDLGGTPPIDAGPPPPKRRVVGTTNTHLIGFDEACTHGIPASTPDRWCAFTRNTSELWILNVTKAAQGAVPCNGSDPGCRLLTSKLFLPAASSKNNTHTKPQFFGDLLIYYAESTQDVPSDAKYRGGIFGWHPSFAEPRRMTSATGFRCESHPQVSMPTGTCLDINGAGAVELRGGMITASQPLPLVWTLGENDRFILEPNRTGDRLVFMQNTAGVPARPLFLLPAAEVADPAKRIMLAPNVYGLEQSTDGTLVYVIREEGNKGGLFSVDTATGTKVTEIAAAMEGVSALLDDRGTDLGLVAYDGFAGDTANARLILDRTNPMKTVALGRVGGAAVSPDKAYTLISTQVVTTPSRLTDAKIVDNVSLATCVLQPAAHSSRVLPFFSSSSSLVFWREPSAEPLWDNVWMATAKGCAGKRMITGQMLAFNGLPNDAILYKQRNAELSTLVYQRFNPETGATVAGPLTVHEGVGLLSVIEPERKLAVFSSTATGAEGIFVVDLP